MTSNVGPGLSTPRTHHIKLSKGSDEAPLICVARDGSVIPDIQVNPYPGLATQIRSDKTKHSDRVAPFLDVPLDEFSGGMGMLHHDEDKSRYLDGYMIDAVRSGHVMLQGSPTYTTGLGTSLVPPDAGGGLGDVCSWKSVPDGATTEVFISTSSGYIQSNMDIDGMYVPLRKVGSPTGNMTIGIYDPSYVAIKEVTIDVSTLPAHSPYWVWVDWTGTYELFPAYAFKVGISYDSGDADNYIQYWGIGDGIYHRFLDDTTPFNLKMFDYKGAVYGVTIPDDGSVSKLYMLGDRGTCDDNTGALTTTVDATKSWTVYPNPNWRGDIVLITSGNGLLEEQPWRVITDNTSDTLTHDAWTFVHDTKTEYVILSDRWTLKQTLSGRVHDVAVIGGKVYFSFGYPGGDTLGNVGDTDLYIRRYREYNSVDGVWTEEIEMEDNNYFGGEALLGVLSTDSSRWENTIADLFVGSVTPDRTSVSKFSASLDDQDMYADLGVFCSNNRAWTDTIYANSVPSANYYGTYCSVAAGFTTGHFARWEFDAPVDLRGADGLAMRVLVSPAAGGNYETAGDIQLTLRDIDDNADAYNLSGTVNEWVDEYFTLLEAGTATVDMSAVTEIRLRADVDDGAFDISIWGSILMVGGKGLPYKSWHSFEAGEVINSMIEYAGGGGETTMKPWILTDRDVYFIEDDIIKPIYLRELHEFKHPRNGEGVVVADVYLYFNIGERIQRYYAGQLDNIGPDVDYGLPEERQGIPASLAAYPGMLIAAFDAGDSGYSHVMYRRNHGWHELYRSPVVGNRIRNILVVPRSDSFDRLYISEGSEVLWVPLTLNSETETDFPYSYHGHIQTSRIYGTLRETRKYFHSFEVIQAYHQENTASGAVNIRVYYRTSNQSDWSLISDFDTVPREENQIGAYDKGGPWVQFLIELETSDREFSPVYVAGVLDAVERIVVKDAYSYNIVLFEGKAQNLDKGEDDLTGVEIKALLDAWADQELPVLLNSNSAFEDGKYVFVEPVRGRLISNEIVAGKERRTYQLSLLEI